MTMEYHRLAIFVEKRIFGAIPNFFKPVGREHTYLLQGNEFYFIDKENN